MRHSLLVILATIGQYKRDGNSGRWIEEEELYEILPYIRFTHWLKAAESGS